MYEVEVKVRADHDAVRDALDDLNAEALGRVEQVDTYYDAPHRSFPDTDEALRIRRERSPGDAEYDRDGETDRTQLTYKGPLVDDDTKTRREIETAVESADDADEILRALGFDASATVRKVRERYALTGAVISLDTVEGLGEFVEVERESAESAVDVTATRIRSLVADLGLDPDEGIRASYLELLLDADTSSVENSHDA